MQFYKRVLGELTFGVVLLCQEENGFCVLFSDNFSLCSESALGSHVTRELTFDYSPEKDTKRRIR